MIDRKSTVIGLVISFFLMALVFIVGLFVATVITSEIGIPEPIVDSLVVLVALSSGTFCLLFTDPSNISALLLGKGALKVTVGWGLFGGILVSLLNAPFPTLTSHSEFAKYLISECDHCATSIGIHILIAGFLLPFVEEAYFRGCLYRLIRDSFDVFWAVVISTSLFLFCHHYASVGQLVSMFIISLILTYIYHKANAIFASAVAHCSSNIVWFSLGYAYQRGWFS
jgi:membrane protease YdiL (CAAX protease family)